MSMSKIKITHRQDNTTLLVYVAHCQKCGQDVIVPETYYLWYIRMFGVEPEQVAHTLCGGPNMDDYIHSSEWWSKECLDVVHAPNTVNDSAARLVYDRWGTDEYDDCAGLYNTRHRHHGYYGNTTTFCSPFYSAMVELKKFIVKDDTSGQPGTMEQSIGH